MLTPDLHPQPVTGQGSAAGQPARVLTVNVGSSSVKFACFAGEDDDPARTLSGQVERIGLPGTVLRFKTAAGETGTQALQPDAHGEVSQGLLDWFETRAECRGFDVVAHRLVHGGPDFHEPQRVTPELIHAFQSLGPLDPDHLPAEIAMIQAIQERFPRLPQVVCFDTAFHAGMPRVARLLPIPRRYEAIGVRRYGFHGLSYTYLLGELGRLDGEQAARGRVILAHLGNGASMAAVRDGRCLDTSMGFTPTSGLPMSRRSGDLDPGVFPFLARHEGMTAEGFHEMVNHQSGLLGVSETSSDVRDLLAREPADPRAAEAIALFCYQARKWLGGFAAVLGGLDTLVFAGGIGENSAPVRARICEGLDFLGLRLDAESNGNHAALISRAGSQVVVRVIPTDEEIVLARAALAFLPVQ